MTVPITIKHNGNTHSGYYDKSRQLLFLSSMTAELAKELGIEWEEDEEQRRQEGVWIPIEYRPGTEEEYAEFSKFGTCPRSEFKVYTNEMPEDGQDVLITTKWGTVCEDIYHDDVDASYFEDHDDPDDVIAWMPKPKGYVPEDKR